MFLSTRRRNMRRSAASSVNRISPLPTAFRVLTLGRRRPSESCRRLGKRAIHLLKATVLGLEPDEPEGDSAEDPPGTKIEEGWCQRVRRGLHPPRPRDRARQVGQSRMSTRMRLATVQELVTAGRRAIAVRCNVAAEAEVAAMVERVVSAFARL